MHVAQSYQTRDLLTQIRVVLFEVEVSREGKGWLIFCNMTMSKWSIYLFSLGYGCDISHFLTIKTGYDFPKIFIKGQHIGGFDELNNLYRSGELDKLLQ